MWEGHEECDDGNADNTDECPETCAAATCGDGYTLAGVEECDDGNDIDADNCLQTCVLAQCGDGFLGPNEGCDDGNTVDNDECDNDCVPASCGDGVVEGQELCDDGNADNTDACLDTCAPAACGDGFVWAGQEQCDDGNVDNTDACPASCETAACGDGFVWANHEACDDGNDVNSDGCLNGCAAPTCGDGFVWTGHEDCDDGNLVGGDGCEADCTVTPDPCGFGSTIYVDVDAVGNSWANAFTSPYLAMQSAVAGDELWIAEGTYVSIAANAPVINLKSCVDVYGGFVGTEGSLSQRPSPLRVSRLSGDFQSDDGANSFLDNAYHTVSGTNIVNVRLDGVTISNGYAMQNAGEAQYGGGLYLNGSLIEVANVTLQDNRARVRGAGMYLTDSTVQLHDSLLVANTCTACYGGGMYILNGGVQVIEDVVFDQNTAYYSGGAVYAKSADANFTNVDFTANAARGAGAIHIDGSQLSIIDSSFVGNQATTSRGGAVSELFGTLTVENSVFENNTAATSGGAIDLDYGSMTITTTVFQSNTAGGNGGAVNDTAAFSQVSINNSQFLDNHAAGSGGGLAVLYGHGGETNRDLLFEGNSAGSGGAIAVYGTSDPVTLRLRNSLIIDNTATSRGGAVYVGSNVRAYFDNLQVSGNTAENDGGGMWVYGTNDLGELRHLSFNNNNTTAGGGFHIEKLSSLNITNVVLWGNGGDDVSNPDMANITFSCSQEFLGLGEGNMILLASPFVIGPNGELFLNQVPQNGCYNGGSDAAANTSFNLWGADWQNMTTALDASLDVPPVDMGMHYAP